MLTSLLRCRRVDLYTNEVHLDPDQKVRYQNMLQRRMNGEPLQYVVGCSDFCGSQIFLDQRVLIPRPETEILVEHAIHDVPHQPDHPLQILDLGTGSGNIAIALAKAISHCHILANDISSDALTLARDNARFNMVEAKISFACQDMFDFLNGFIRRHAKFDLIVSNPPYIPTSAMTTLPADVRQEPSIALDGGPDGLFFYRRLIHVCRFLLQPQGAIFFEIGDGQDEPIKDLFQKYGEYGAVDFIVDYVGTRRVVRAKRS